MHNLPMHPHGYMIPTFMMLPAACQLLWRPSSLGLAWVLRSEAEAIDVQGRAGNGLLQSRRLSR